MLQILCAAMFLSWALGDKDNPSPSPEAARPDTSSGLTGEVLVSRIQQLAGLKSAGIYTDSDYHARLGQLLHGLTGARRVGTPEEFLSPIVQLVHAGLLSTEELIVVKAFAMRG